jgi:hypothetical protein
MLSPDDVNHLHDLHRPRDLHPPAQNVQRIRDELAHQPGDGIDREALGDTRGMLGVVVRVRLEQGLFDQPGGACVGRDAE